MLHLALSHFIVKLEEKYITPEFIDGAGERLCPHCGQLQPPNKLSFIRHIAMEHEDIIEVFAADKMFGNKWKILFKILGLFSPFKISKHDVTIHLKQLKNNKICINGAT